MGWRGHRQEGVLAKKVHGQEGAQEQAAAGQAGEGGDGCCSPKHPPAPQGW